MKQKNAEQNNSAKSRRKSMLIILVIIIVVLFIPVIFKEKSRAPLQGPSLSEIEYSEIFFNNGDLQLAGMLIHGSGTSTRDSKWYLSVAKHLQENGIAVLLPDKRGSEKSGGDWRGASFNDLAAFIEAAQ